MPTTRSDRIRPVLARATRYEMPLFALVITLLLIPTLFVRSLSILLYICPLIIVSGVWSLNREVSFPIPTWLIYDVLSIITVIYGSYALGTQVPLPLLIIVAGAFTLYDSVAVRTLEEMEATSLAALKRALPIAILLPNSESFEFAAFIEAMESGTFEPTFGEGPAGATILGVIDLIFPGSLAVARSAAGFQIWVFSISPLALGVIVGASIGFAILLFVELDSPIGASTVTLPCNLIGLVVAIELTGQTYAVLGF